MSATNSQIADHLDALTSELGSISADIRSRTSPFTADDRARTELLKAKRELRQTQLQNAKQLTIEAFFARPGPSTGGSDDMEVDGAATGPGDEPVVEDCE